MQEVADGVWQISSVLPNAINAYLVGDVLVDTGTRSMLPRFERALAGRTVSMVALTHAHSDHQGCAHELCTRLNIPLVCHQLEAARVDGRELLPARTPYMKFGRRFFAGPPHPVDHFLADGDRVAGFQVIHTPGHSIGHVALFRESDRVAIVGDAINNMNILTGMPGLHRPPDFVNENPAQVNVSLRRIADLEPEVVCFGHGAVLQDRDRLQAFARKLTA
ncbi:MAG: MBL fold metallo-hydrolase [Candidatus Dormibacteria bacterium]